MLIVIVNSEHVHREVVERGRRGGGHRILDDPLDPPAQARDHDR